MQATLSAVPGEPPRDEELKRKRDLERLTDRRGLLSSPGDGKDQTRMRAGGMGRLHSHVTAEEAQKEREREIDRRRQRV